MYKLLPVLFLLFSCRSVREPDVPENAEPVLSFIVMTLTKKSDKPAVLKLVSRTDAPGTMKKPLSDNLRSPYYLKVYAYSGKKALDSVTLEHPLYKHLEYRDEDGHFAIKDTVLESAQFFVRFQSKQVITELKALEFIQNQSTGKWITLKL